MPRRHPSLEGRELDQARRRPLGTPPRHGGGASAGHAPADPPLTPLPGGHAHGRAPRPGTEAEATQTRDSSLLPGLRLRVSAEGSLTPFPSTGTPAARPCPRSCSRQPPSGMVSKMPASPARLHQGEGPGPSRALPSPPKPEDLRPPASCPTAPSLPGWRSRAILWQLCLPRAVHRNQDGAFSSPEAVFSAAATLSPITPFKHLRTCVHAHHRHPPRRTHTGVHTHTCTQAHTRAHCHARSHNHMHIQKDVHAHLHTHMHTHTVAHTLSVLLTAMSPGPRTWHLTLPK
ncbi:leucine-rich repeat extensin-like protein 5 isoform X1 [Choloepus didactylus]|uniref:leucine-rich repeat extensin-like protein 5 isoform X1 n=1 Tax=Choloepus didactylus TaxID=27675 RepID=UPI00189F4E9B|nr:leucine-rich repeat extensin-like protein 5 isoform X1 [Choloepus didactylus]